MRTSRSGSIVDMNMHAKAAREVLRRLVHRGHSPEPVSLTTLRNVPGPLGEIVRHRAEQYLPGGAVTPTTLFEAWDAERFGELTSTYFTATTPRPSFRAAITTYWSNTAMAGGDVQLSVIAELQRKGQQDTTFNAVETARRYEAAGAAALSVLTEETNFSGSLRDLGAVAAESPLPILRKDFVVHPLQIFGARLAGASAVLLITVVLQEQLKPYIQFARAVGLEPVVEVHDEAEFALAAHAGADIIDINNRHLVTGHTDVHMAVRVAEFARKAQFRGLITAESGYRTAADLHGLHDLIDAVLLGPRFLGENTPEHALASVFRRDNA